MPNVRAGSTLLFLGHDQPEWLAGVLGRLQSMEASIAAISEAADRRPAVSVADLPNEAERRRSFLQFTKRLFAHCIDIYIRKELFSEKSTLLVPSASVAPKYCSLPEL